MATSVVTPDQSDAPQVQYPQAPPPSNLGATLSQPPTPVLDESGDPNTAFPTSGGGGSSRLLNIIKAVASVGATGVASVPAHGRASFINGASQGAQGAIEEQKYQQAIKFKTFDDAVRAANLSNQDKELQMHTQAQADAHQAAQDAQHDWDEAHGLQYDEIPNSGQAATDHLTAQTTANGAASIPAGTHLSADGKTILIPKQSDDNQAAQLLKYNTFAPAFGLPSLPKGAQFVPPKNLDMLQHKLEGHSISGDIYTHDQLPGAIADLQSTRDSLAGKGGNADVLTQLSGTIKSMQAKLDYLDTHAATVKQQNEQATLDAQTSPQSIKGAADKASAIADAELPDKLKVAQAQSDIKANAAKVNAGDWLPKVGADEKKKAELAENIAFNANEVAKLVMKRPDILGAVAGRFTDAQQMIGNNDPDISALGVHVHNMAMANSGVHGFRSQEGVESYERQLLNNFKNGPAAMAGALRASTGSVQTFIDNARPESYKTHSKQGGAVRGMTVTQ